MYKIIATDENGKQQIEFKDKEGKLILKKSQLNNTLQDPHKDWLCTYYVYDDFNNLRFVIPPKAVTAVMAGWSFNALPDVVNELCFIYEYDERGRLIRKKVPGAAFIEMVYDLRDRLAFSQDGNLKVSDQWLATFYDSQNRVTMTALYKNPATRSALQTTLNSSRSTTSIPFTFPGIAELTVANYDGSSKYEATNSVTLSDGFDSGAGGETEIVINPTGNNGSTVIAATYTMPAIDPAALTPLTYNYYDDYSFNDAQPLVAADLSKLQTGGSTTAEPATTNSTMTKGLVTGTKTLVLGTKQYLTTTIYYDDKGRKIQVVSDNLNNGKDIVSNLYDFEGKVLSTFQRKKNPRSGTTPETRLLTVLTYDHADHVLTIAKQINETGSLKVIAQSRYNALGQLLTKTLGASLDSMKYDYNIRGWVLGANRNFVKTGASNFFGFDLGYDQAAAIIPSATYTRPQFNGNISGTIWRSKGDQASRKYDFAYDNVNRLTAGDFLQQPQGSTTWANNQVDFSVSGLSYDQNGNILFMNQKGLKAGASQMIDSLKYIYPTNSNKLSAVTDRRNDSQSKLGDFRETTNNESADYAYDANGNLKQDNNKQLTINRYNHLNLPDSITIVGKGNITYVYDAAGNKLRKKVTDITGAGRVTTTDYMDNFVFENDTLEFISHEEGRIRPLYVTGQPIDYTYDYFEKDHLGNVRLVLTEQQDLSIYTATMEADKAPVETALFSNIDESRVPKPIGYPQDESAGKNASVAKLNAQSGGKKIGPSLVLRVMAGDTIQIGARAFYKSQAPVTNNTPPPVEDMVAGLIQAFGSSAPGDAQHGVTTENNTPFNTDFYNNNYQQLKEKDPDQNNQNRPKAYLNFVLFDDQFKLVDANSGVRQVKGTPDELQTLAVDKMPVTRNGFLYVYTSNETQQDVFFDNIVVAKAASPVLEETHYYPFGLTMAGISNVALVGPKYPRNRKGFAGKEIQSSEFSDGSGLNQYDFGARFYDQQIGRWQVNDPLSEKYYWFSPYQYAANNPILYVDVDGRDIIATIMKNGFTLPEPRSVGDLGVTGYLKRSMSAQYNNTTKEYDLRFAIGSNFTKAFGDGKSGPLEQQNPGLFAQTEAHEQGHQDQYMEAAKLEITVNIGGKDYTGRADQVLTSYKTDYDNTTKEVIDQKKKSGDIKTSKDEKQFLKNRNKEFAKSEGVAINSVVTAVQEKLDDLDKSLSKDAELDANNRGQIKQGIPPKYHEKNLPVYNGTILR